MIYMTIDISELKGKTLKEIKVHEEEVTLETEDGSKYKMYHEQDCCENVYVEDVIGDIEDLIGNPLLMAEEVTNQYDTNEDYRWTWTDRKSTRLNSSHVSISYAVFCLKKKNR